LSKTEIDNEKFLGYMKIESKTVEFLKFLEEDNWDSTESKARELAQFRA
jgi:hypothetical protein